MFARIAGGSLVVGLILAFVSACSVDQLSDAEVRSTSAINTRQAAARKTVNARAESTKRVLTAIAVTQTPTSQSGCVYVRLGNGSVIDTCTDEGGDDAYYDSLATESAIEQATQGWLEYRAEQDATHYVDIDAERADATEYALEKAAAESAESDAPAEVAGFVDAPEEGWSECDPAYPDFCIPPPELVGDLDCADVDGSYFTVYDPDPHGFDGDYDGVGCEWP